MYVIRRALREQPLKSTSWKASLENRKFRETEIERIERLKYFKYLGETIVDNGIDKAAVSDRNIETERAYVMTENNNNNNKCILWNARRDTTTLNA